MRKLGKSKLGSTLMQQLQRRVIVVAKEILCDVFVHICTPWLVAQPRSSDSGHFSHFIVSLFTVTKQECQFAYPNVLIFVFYAAHAD